MAENVSRLFRPYNTAMLNAATQMLSENFSRDLSDSFWSWHMKESKMFGSFNPKHLILESIPTNMEKMAPDISTWIERALERLGPFLEQDKDARPIVLMTCGIAGSGKSTLAKAIVKARPELRRVSIDEIICSKHGLYGIDFPADARLYQEYQDEADKIFVQTVENLLKEKQNIVLERSFWARSTRDEFKERIEKGGGRWVLAYLQMNDREEVWKRICNRRVEGKNADSAFDISGDIFDSYWKGFEIPRGESEVILET